jgi:nickel-dependent lactate racemase
VKDDIRGNRLLDNRPKAPASNRPAGGEEKSMVRICLPGRPSRPVDIPAARLGEVVSLPPAKAAADPEGIIGEALAHPIGTPCLERLVRAGQQIAVIIDDITRATPTAVILPMILKTLEGRGVPHENIAIVIALGTHRPMTPPEIDRKIGPAIAARYRIVNIPANESTGMVYMGRSSRGIPAWVNRVVAEADVRIGIGMIAPHLDAGYSGGAKIILPGVCSQETVDAFHSQMAAIETNPLGVEDAALRMDLERFVDECVRLDFILNGVLDSGDNLVRCVAGDAVKAHRSGIRFAREVYGASVRRRYPLVVANAYPHHIDLWQSTKALAGAELMTRTHGRLILVADCPEGIGPHPRFADYIGMDLDELLRRFDRGDIADRCAAAEAVAVCRMKRRLRIGLVSSGLAPEEVCRMGFSHYPSVEAAVRDAPVAGKEGPIGLLTHGGVTLPLLPVGCPPG